MNRNKSFNESYKELKLTEDLYFNAELLYELIKEYDPSVNKEGNSFSVCASFPNKNGTIKVATLLACKTSDGRIELFIEDYANYGIIRYPDNKFLYLINHF